MANTITVYRKKRNYDTTKLKDGIVRVGFFESSRYEGGKSVASVARYNEFGLGVPRRSFMRPAVHRNRQQLRETLKADYRQTIRNNGNTMNVLSRFGLYVQGLIQNQIIQTYSPPNAPSTIKRKGFNAPLRDSRLMLHSVQHQEEEITK